MPSLPSYCSNVQIKCLFVITDFLVFFLHVFIFRWGGQLSELHQDSNVVRVKTDKFQDFQGLNKILEEVNNFLEEHG